MSECEVASMSVTSSKSETIINLINRQNAFLWLDKYLHQAKDIKHLKIKFKSSIRSTGCMNQLIRTLCMVMNTLRQYVTMKKELRQKASLSYALFTRCEITGLIRSETEGF